MKTVIINIRWIPGVLLPLTDGNPSLLSLKAAMSFGFCALDFLAPPEASCSGLIDILMPYTSVSGSPFLVIQVSGYASCLNLPNL